MHVALLGAGGPGRRRGGSALGLDDAGGALPGVARGVSASAMAARCDSWYVRARFASSRIAGSPRRRSVSSGVAMKIEENVPTAMPMNSTIARSSRVPGPMRVNPKATTTAIGSSATTEVLIERTSVWLMA
ncbi:hypothetical protein GCM10025872_17270 [Barrientosiimonas endolithica]|uniref:Uncharacterized protein n=1 Tax=Barrientosiimonas endolithica TaxID=1535208 RepID=A0ABM8HAV0_9MICO|nr:hypothetical protein GCM10025872_17270 [Barrientosiimonas endolithica]